MARFYAVSGTRVKNPRVYRSKRESLKEAKREVTSGDATGACIRELKRIPKSKNYNPKTKYWS